LADIGRIRDKIRTGKASLKKFTGNIDFEGLDSESRAKIVLQVKNVAKSYGDKLILKDFSMIVQRGEKIGIVGNNGCGKSTFLRIITGSETADSGSSKLAKNLNISYFDQKRDSLNLRATLWETLAPNGGDYIMVRGKLRHVVAYLKDFMFDAKDARTPVGGLSGGQQNRLLLAKILANPTDFLILDEPTNDLDMETLDMLEQIITDYTGTLFIVSHDREFLDRTVTKTLAFEGDGDVGGYIGGYSDYLAEKEKKDAAKLPPKTPVKAKKVEEVIVEDKPKQLSYKLKLELELLPRQIASFEKQMGEINATLAASNLFVDNPNKAQELMLKLSELGDDLSAAETRWLFISEMV
jgi:ABC transport system ATP-binding/permease protein